MSGFGGVCAFALIAGVSAPAFAQAPPSAEAVVYEPAFFAPFSPRTALDMVVRVPGFTLDEGEERRGFAGAQSNVLIDSEPPTSKAQEIDDILARIPAADVVRIELIRGAGSNASSAQGVRVNVVRRAGSGEGVWELSAQRARDGRVTPNGEASWSGRRGALEYGLSANYDSTHYPVRGVRTDYDASGALSETRIERIPADEREAALAGEASFPWLGGAAALNAQISRWDWSEREATDVFDAGGAVDGTIAGALEEQEDVGEIGASWRRELGPWRAEFGAVITRRAYESDEDTAEFDDSGALDEAARQTQRIDSGETIVRGAFRRSLSAQWRIEFGAEAALNTLEQELTLTEDTGAGPVPVILPSANVLVEEERAEASAMLAGALASRWTLEAGASIEASRISQSGDANQDAELTYWKPSLQLTRSLGERDQVRVRFYRDVGQLDFEDFVSAADITSSVVSAGNPNLRPETSWRLEAAGDWRFGEDGAFGLVLYRWAIEDALDIVPVGPPGNQLDAPGNIGDATAYGARVSLALPLPWDAELRVDGMAQRSEATDPLTGETRSISEVDESALVIGFRQDIGAFAWGADYEREIEAPSYRLDQIERERDAEELSVWIETTAFGDVKWRAWGANLSDSAELRDRRLFDPDRLGAFDGSDHRARRAGLTFGVSTSGSF
jgi:outer membrane receptor protein involved in Fe transport